MRGIREMRETGQIVQVLGEPGDDLEGFDGLDGLTPKRAAFVREFCVDHNGTQAAIRAGYSEATADEQASRLLANVKVRKAVADRMVAAAKAAGVDAAFVVSELFDLATADPRELSRIEIDCCRHCYGTDYLYQWTKGEYTRALDQALSAGKPAPDIQGGLRV
jgi:phage terminase small subunit